MTKKTSTKAKLAKATPLERLPISKLSLLPGDEVELADGTAVYIGQLQGGSAFRVPGADRFTWPGEDALGRVLRSPNRERAVSAEQEVDPLRGRSA